MFDISTFTQGLALGLGMFVCPGPKDVLILRQALFRQPAAELIAVGVLSDALLIWLGMAGVSAALNRAPALQNAALWLGVFLMLLHGLFALRHAAAGTVEAAVLARDEQTLSRSKSLATVVMVSLFNPVAWLDTVLVIGTAGSALPGPGQTSFAIGAIAASATWFVALVIGARFAGNWMILPSTWKALDVFVAVTMVGLAAYLARGLL